MKRVTICGRHLILGFLVLVSSALIQQHAGASPFGKGVFGADVPFGSQTSISIALGGNVNINMTPSGANFSGTGSHTLTVTSNDVDGYKLYASAPSGTDMMNGSDTISTSANSSPGALATNSWGYNTSGSTVNFVGMLTTPTQIKDAAGPYTSGDDTTVTYGVIADITKGAGYYTVHVAYTAVPD
ncbi:MAG TPA: hypothetical protein VMT96_01145 [Candidatus Bathyarchaeia archaeon]|nr:hypothetical protein [Candidatus Bathyarchaeia archaeon]